MRRHGRAPRWLWAALEPKRDTCARCAITGRAPLHTPRSLTSAVMTGTCQTTASWRRCWSACRRARAREGERATPSELRGPLQHCARPCFGCTLVLRDGSRTIYIAYKMAYWPPFGHKYRAVSHARCSARVGDSTVPLGTYEFVHNRMRLGSACGAYCLYNYIRTLGSSRMGSSGT